MFGVSLLCFKYPGTLKSYTANAVIQILVFEKDINFPKCTR